MTKPSFGPTGRDPFPGCERLTAAMVEAAEAERASKPGPEQLGLPYRTFTLSSRWELHADGREFIDGVEVRPPWWRRWLHWLRR